MLYEHHPHPHITARRQQGPVTTAGALPGGSRYARASRWLAAKITAGVGSMTCAYLFALLALVSLPAALASRSVIVIVSWVAQTFLQLVLLSVILVGQNISAASSDARAVQTYKDAEAVLAEAIKIQQHLEAQDEVLTSVIHLLAAGKDQ